MNTRYQPAPSTPETARRVAAGTPVVAPGGAVGLWVGLSPRGVAWIAYDANAFDTMRIRLAGLWERNHLTDDIYLSIGNREDMI